MKWKVILKKVSMAKNFKLLTRKEKLVIYDKLVNENDEGEECWICGKVRVNRRLHIDHDHKTGKIRGLLCMACNRGLAWFKDKPENLRNAAKYLRRTK